LDCVGQDNLDFVRRAVIVLVGLGLGCGPTGRADREARRGADLDPPALPGASAPNLAATAAGDALLTWLEPAGAGAHRLQLSRLSRGPSPTWSNPVTIAEGRALVASWADVPSVVQADDGVMVAHWAEARPAASAATSGAGAVRGAGGMAGHDVALARSTDGGLTWKRIGTANDDRGATEHGFVSLLPEGSRVRAFWLDGRETGPEADRASGSTGAMTLRTALIGAAVEPSQVLDERVCDCCSTAAARTDRGPILAYRDRSDDEVRDVAVLTRDERAAGASWSASRPVYRDGWRIAGCPVNGPAVAARGRAAVVAWYTAPTGLPGVRVAFSRDGGLRFDPAIEIDRGVAAPAVAGRSTSERTTIGVRPLGHVSAVLEPGGEALIAWTRTAANGAEVLVRRVAPDGRLGAERSVARLARPASGATFPRMIGLGDDVLLAWIEPGPRPRLRSHWLPRRSIAPVGEHGARALPSTEADEVDVDDEGPVAGEPAPNFTAATLRGEPVRLDMLRGEVVLLNVWATWCLPCRVELADLATLHGRRARDGLSIVAVSVDAADARERVAEVARPLPFAVWLDPNDVVSTRFAVRSLPTTMLVGRDGKIRWRRDGVVAAGDPELERELDAALAEPSP
jgi:peroxiredoxin